MIASLFSSLSRIFINAFLDSYSVSIKLMIYPLSAVNLTLLSTLFFSSLFFRLNFCGTNTESKG
jgi:hypothetical protein